MNTTQFKPEIIADGIDSTRLSEIPVGTRVTITEQPGRVVYEGDIEDSVIEFTTTAPGEYLIEFFEEVVIDGVHTISKHGIPFYAH